LHQFVNYFAVVDWVHVTIQSALVYESYLPNVYFWEIWSVDGVPLRYTTPTTGVD